MSVAWAVAALFLSLIPSFVTMALKGNLALAGAVVALMLGFSALVQVVAYRFESLRAQAVGLTVMIPGLVALIVADMSQTLVWLLVTTVLGGIGMGLAFMSLGMSTRSRPPIAKATSSPAITLSSTSPPRCHRLVSER